MASFISSLPLRPRARRAALARPAPTHRALARPPLPTLCRAARIHASTAAPAAASAAPASPLHPRGVAPRELWAGVRRLAGPLYAPGRRWRALGWTALVLALALASTLYAVAMSTVLRLFWNALSAKDPAKFAKLLKGYAVAVVVGPVVLTSFDWVKGRLALLWRRALTDRFLGEYFDDRRSAPYYQVAMGGAVDNSDQRLTEDVRAFTERAVRFLCVFGVAVFDLVIFSFVLYKIYPPLFFALIAYTLFGTVGVSLYGRSLVGTNARQLELEANYRFALLRVRDNAESIAFYRGGASEKGEALRRFRNLFANTIRLLGMNRNVALFATSHRYWVQVIPSAIMGPAYFAGDIALGTISQTLFSFNHVLSSMGLFVAEFVALSEFGAGVRRLEKLSGEIDVALIGGAAHGTVGIETITREAGEPSRLAVTGLCLQTPTSPHRPLVQNLTLTVEPGERLLITGQSGVGKTSLLRALAGLWKVGAGTVSRPSDSETLFLPQKPFLSLNSLRDNVVYPLEGDAAAALSDEEVKAALWRVNLPNVVERRGGLDASGEEIGRTLSIGEQQRLAFARVVTTRPKFVLLDESTSALDEDNLRKMYELLKELGVTCVSVGNQTFLPEYHDSCLRLAEDGSWNLTKLG